MKKQKEVYHEKANQVFTDCICVCSFGFSEFKAYECAGGSDGDKLQIFESTVRNYTQLREYNPTTLTYRSVMVYDKTMPLNQDSSATFEYLYNGYGYYYTTGSNYYKVKLADGTTTSIDQDTWYNMMNKSAYIFY